MDEVSYDSKQLLTVLKEIEQNLEHAMAINGFLTNHELKGEEISYLSAQIVCKYLKYEVQKAKNVIIEAHYLRAYKEFHARHLTINQLEPYCGKHLQIKYVFLVCLLLPLLGVLFAYY